MLQQLPLHWSVWELMGRLTLVSMDRMLSLAALALHKDFIPKQKYGQDTMGLRLWHSLFLLLLLRKVCFMACVHTCMSSSKYHKILVVSPGHTGFWGLINGI